MVLESVFGFSEPGGTFSTPNRYLVMLPNEVFALGCRAWYEEQGLIVDETNGEFAHCPYPKRYGDAGYYLLHSHHQHQGLLQSQDIGERCFFTGDTKRWLLECDYFPKNYFELWDIYEKYVNEHNGIAGVKGAEKVHSQKDEFGHSLHTLKLHEEKDEEGRSVHAMKMHSQKDELGRSVSSMKCHAQKDELGRSVHGVTQTEKLHAQKNEFGKSSIAVRSGKKLHEKRDEFGRSIHTVKINSQMWSSTLDGFVSTAAGVASHNRSIGGTGKDKIKLTQQ